MDDYNLDINKLAKAYFIAKKYVIQNGYSNEIDWQDEINLNSLTYQSFLKEYTWVVLASGLSDKVVSKVFPKIQIIFRNWTDLDYILQNYATILSSSLKIFNNKPKINALLKTVTYIKFNGFEFVKKRIYSRGIEYLKTFSFIGEATCYHLAKNIGLSCAKPDRHLLRISKSVGYNTPHDLCKVISEYIAEKIQVVDLVIWRYATLDNNYESKLKKLVLPKAFA